MPRRDDFTRNHYALIIDAITRGETEAAKMHLAHMMDEWKPIHDMYGDAEGVLLTFIAEKLGEEAIEEAHRYVGEVLWKPLLKAVKDRGTEVLAELVGFFLRGHGYKFTCDEDEGKYVFTLAYCPTGERMVKEGKTDTSDWYPVSIGTTKKAYPWSFNRKGILYYCCHCPLWMNILPKEWGWNVLAVEFGQKADNRRTEPSEPCKIIVYKQPRV